MSGTYDWTKFGRRIDINAQVDVIYKAIATQAGMESWFLRLAEFTMPDKTVRNREDFIKKDDTYRWLWHGYGDNTEERGAVLDTNGTDMIKFTFADSCVVTITIKPEQETNVVELWQENIPTDEKAKANWHLGCSVGWTFYLANLKSILTGGLDLRNKNEGVKNVVSA